MCEFCSKTEITIEKLDVDEEEYPCEWILEEAGPGACAALALYSVSEWYVEDHLCDAHRLATEKEMEEGLGAFLDSAGFRSQFEIRPIEQKETCDYLAPNSADWEPCGKKATFAKYILDSTLVCAEHAAAMNQKSEET
jgi:hypothetical protein